MGSTAAEGARPDDARRYNRHAVLRRLGDDAQLIGAAELAFGPVLDAAASAATA
ncbi:MAG: hypothetical protein ACRDUV_14965 [Pseudonocardiaceae bacterium]